jgi:hypothetical protein
MNKDLPSAREAYAKAEDLITGEIDLEDLERGGDGIVYAQTPEEAARIRAYLRKIGQPLHGVK